MNWIMLSFYFLFALHTSSPVHLSLLIFYILPYYCNISKTCINKTCIFSTFGVLSDGIAGLPPDTRTPQWHLCTAFCVVHSVLWTVNLKGALWPGLNAVFTVDLALSFVALAVHQIATVYDWSYPGHFIFICLQNVYCLPGHLHIQIFNAPTYKVVIPNAVCRPIHEIWCTLSSHWLFCWLWCDSVLHVVETNPSSK